MATRSEKIENYCNEAVKIANDDSHGYSNVVGDNLGPQDFDCGGFVSECLKRAGVLRAGQVYEPNERYGNPWSYGSVLEPAGFERIPFSKDAVQRGDILIKDGRHTELALGNGKQVGAHSNYDGVSGDYGHAGEISVVPLSGYWDYIYRLKKEPIVYPEVPFAAKVLIDDLNLRKGASTSAAVKGYAAKGNHIIDEVKNDFGYIKKLNGWIYLAEPKYVKIGAHIEMSPFKDINTDDPDYTAIKAVYEAGLMRGSNGKFKPSGKVTRRQMAIILYRILKLLKAK